MSRFTTWSNEIKQAICKGSKAFNAGDHATCEKIYYSVLVDMGWNGALGFDFAGPSNKATARERAWEYRHMLDGILQRRKSEDDKRMRELERMEESRKMEDLEKTITTSHPAKRAQTRPPRWNVVKYDDYRSGDTIVATYGSEEEALRNLPKSTGGNWWTESYKVVMVSDN